MTRKQAMVLAAFYMDNGRWQSGVFWAEVAARPWWRRIVVNVPGERQPTIT